MYPALIFISCICLLEDLGTHVYLEGVKGRSEGEIFCVTHDLR